MSTRISIPPQPPDENRDANRAWLNEVLDRVFDGVISQMAKTLGYSSNRDEKRFRRVVTGTTSTIPGEMIHAAREYIEDAPDVTFVVAEPGEQYRQREVTHPAAYPLISLTVAEDDSGTYRVDTRQDGTYYLDPRDVTESIRTAMYAAYVPDADLSPRLPRSSIVLMEPVPDPLQVPQDGVYVYRMDHTLHTRRVEHLPDRRVRLIPSEEDGAIEIDLTAPPDLAFHGRVCSYRLPM